MISKDLVVDNLDARQLENAWKLFVPPGLSKELRILAIVLDGGRPWHAWQSGPRRDQHHVIDVNSLPFSGTSQRELARLAQVQKVSGVAVVERATLSGLRRDIEAGLTDSDLATQCVHALSVLRETKGLWLHPPLLSLIPPLQMASLQKVFALLIPANASICAFVLDEGCVYTSILAYKGKVDIEEVGMFPVLQGAISEREVNTHWRQNPRRVAHAIESRLAAPSVCVFVERSAVLRILQGPPEQLATELRSKNLLVDPCPAWLSALLTGASAAAFANRSAKRALRFMPKSARALAQGVAGAAQERLKESAANPFAALGFDPIALLKQLREFYRQ